MPSPRVSLVSQPREAAPEVEKGTDNIIGAETLLNLVSIIDEVLEKVYNQLLEECADRVLSESLPDDMQESSPRVDTKSTPNPPPVDIAGSQGEGAVSKSNPETPLSISFDSNTELEREEVTLEADVQMSKVSEKVSIYLVGCKLEESLNSLIM